MTDTEKVKLIGTMIADIYEFTDNDRSAYAALVACIDDVCAFGGRDADM